MPYLGQADIDAHIADFNNPHGVNYTQTGGAAAVHTHLASEIASGTFADARIAETNVTQHQGALSITESQISDLGNYLVDITGQSIASLSDVVVTAVTTGEVLAWDGTGWINRTLSEINAVSQTDLATALSGKADTAHTHVMADITDATWISDYSVTQSDVTQHQGALSITESQISDLGNYLVDITGQSIASLSDVAITSPAAGEVLAWSGTGWINQTLGEAGIATAAQGALADTAVQPGDNVSTLVNDSGFITGVAWGNITGTVSSQTDLIDTFVPKQTPINPQGGTTYTLVLSDNGKYIRMSNVAANTITVPPNSSVAFDVGTQIHIIQSGSGQTTVAEGAGVIINSAETLKLRKQYSSATLIKVTTDQWDLIGDLELA